MVWQILTSGDTQPEQHAHDNAVYRVDRVPARTRKDPGLWWQSRFRRSELLLSPRSNDNEVAERRSGFVKDDPERLLEFQGDRHPVQGVNAKVEGWVGPLQAWCDLRRGFSR